MPIATGTLPCGFRAVFGSVAGFTCLPIDRRVMSEVDQCLGMIGAPFEWCVYTIDAGERGPLHLDPFDWKGLERLVNEGNYLLIINTKVIA